MSPATLTVTGVAKRFQIGVEKVTGARYLVESALRNPLSLFCPPRATDFWALKDINLSVGAGEVVALLGRNGAGKSTLLKLISRISLPTAGNIRLRGRVGSLLEVGTGFHPELTGRENIFLNGALLGMRRAEILKNFDAIVDFSEVGQFLDTPVKHYSSGMYVRLGFAIASHLESELLIVDEVLAVGDQKFQKRCVEKLSQVGRSGRTILFVSHNPALVASFCTRGVYLENGTIAFDGAVGEALALYQQRGTPARSSGAEGILLADLPRSSREKAVIRRLRMCRADGVQGMSFSPEEVVRFEMDCLYAGGIPYLNCVMKIAPVGGAPLFCVFDRSLRDFMKAPTSEFTVSCEFVMPPLVPGGYTVSLELYSDGNRLDDLPTAAEFEITPADFFGTSRAPNLAGGPVMVKSKWELKEK